MIPLESHTLFHHPLLWRGRQRYAVRIGVTTGFPQLDEVLPNHGWPQGVLIEITTPAWGIGELRLLHPTITRLFHQQRQVAWVAPPYIPYPPALADSGGCLENMLILEPSVGNITWTIEKLLGIDSCGLVLAWPHRLSDPEARRLQLAAQAGDTLAMVLRRDNARWQATTAALRLQVHPKTQGIQVEICKARGALGRTQVVLSL